MKKTKCLETEFGVTISEHEGKFTLPEASSGAEEERQCELGGHTFQHGHIMFECVDGEWSMATQTCSDCSDGGCAALQFTYTLSGHEGNFDLPCGDAGATVDQPCHFEDEIYEKGTVVFECAAGKWEMSDETCEGTTSGNCDPVEFTVNVNGHTAEVNLPQQDAAGVREMPCKFTDKTYDFGVVKFVCQDGKWDVETNTCSDCPEDGCSAVNFEVDYEGNVGSFNLPCGLNSQELSMDCVFNDKTFAGGKVNFICDGEKQSWQYQKSSKCTE